MAGTPKKVYQFDLDGNIIRDWQNTWEAAEGLGYKKTRVQNAITNGSRVNMQFYFSFENKKPKQSRRIKSSPRVKNLPDVKDRVDPRIKSRTERFIMNIF